jgi:hypothetical protein
MHAKSKRRIAPPRRQQQNLSANRMIHVYCSAKVAAEHGPGMTGPYGLDYSKRSKPKFTSM